MLADSQLLSNEGRRPAASRTQDDIADESGGGTKHLSMKKGSVDQVHRAFSVFDRSRVLEADASSTTSTAAVIVVVVQEAEVRCLSLVSVYTGSV